MFTIRNIVFVYRQVWYYILLYIYISYISRSKFVNFIFLFLYRERLRLIKDEREWHDEGSKIQQKRAARKVFIIIIINFYKIINFKGPPRTKERGNSLTKKGR
jgi:hypothetical protein